MIAGALVLGGLFAWMQPDPPPSGAGPSAAAPAPARAAFELRVERGELVSGPGVIRVRQGDAVAIHITSDAADELHLHGYDLHLPLRAGEPATLEFEAHLSGRFGYELHGAHVELGALEVVPD